MTIDIDAEDANRIRKICANTDARNPLRIDAERFVDGASGNIDVTYIVKVLEHSNQYSDREAELALWNVTYGAHVPAQTSAITRALQEYLPRQITAANPTRTRLKTRFKMSALLVGTLLLFLLTLSSSGVDGVGDIARVVLLNAVLFFAVRKELKGYAEHFETARLDRIKRIQSALGCLGI